MKREGKITIDGFQVYELIRTSKQGGGLAIGALNEIEPAFISEGDDETEILVIEVKLNDLETSCINGYGPQENDGMEKKVKFWERIGNEVEDAIVNDKALLFQMDGNLHAGSDLIIGDPNKCNTNGRLFKEFLSKYPHLTVVNATDLCE